MNTKARTVLALAFTFVLVVTWAHVQPAKADTSFNQNLIFSDDNLLDFSRMSVDQIQAFLTAHGSVLATYTVTAGDGTQQSAAQVIYNAAQTYQLNPQFLLTTLQKEEGLIDGQFSGSTLQTRLDWAMGFGVCDSCSVNDPSIQAYKGFANQIAAAAQQVRKYLTDLTSRGYTVSGWGPGITKNLTCISSDASRGLCAAGSSISITPANNATAVLYTYTPHPGGNYSFWTLWNSYNFAFQRYYPDGTVLKTSKSNDIFVLQYGQLRKFKNIGVFLSRYSVNSIITVSAADLLPYPHGPDINFPNYSLLKSPSGGVYLLVDDTKRAIATRSAFQKAGFSWEEVVKASWDDLNQYADGEDITVNNVYPSGLLVQAKSGAIFQLKDGVLHGVYTKDIMKNQFGKQKPVRLSTTLQAASTVGGPVLMRDGMLIQSKLGGPIYVVSDGYILPINSMAIFSSYHYSTKNVVRVAQSTIDIHPVGPALDALTSPVQLAGQR